LGVDNFLLGGTASSILVILSVVAFGAALGFKLKSSVLAAIAALLVGAYWLLDGYVEGSLAVKDSKVIAADTVCMDGVAYKRDQKSLFEGEGLTLVIDTNGSAVKCIKLKDAK
jgi:hypothetical protein